MEINEKYMQRALELARRGLIHVSPNPMVGAVIVAPDGKIIGEGYHRKYGEAHAEVNAINAVADKEALKDCTMYVNLEPCAHTGHTGPCADLIIKMGIPRVAVGCRDPFDKVNGRGIEKLRAAGVEVEVGVLEDDCKKLNAMFFTPHILHRPYILLKWAQSVDKFLDVKREPGIPAPKISSPLSQTLVHRVRSYFRGIVVGSGTILADDPELSVRLWPGRSPKPIVLDRRGRVNESHRIMQRDPLIIREDKPLAEIMRDLYEQGITSVVVEGGPTLLKSFISEGLWDLARVETGTSMFGEFGAAPAPRLPGFEPMRTYLIEGQTIKYYANNPYIDGKIGW